MLYFVDSEDRISESLHLAKYRNLFRADDQKPRAITGNDDRLRFPLQKVRSQTQASPPSLLLSVSIMYIPRLSRTSRYNIRFIIAFLFLAAVSITIIQHFKLPVSESTTSPHLSSVSHRRPTRKSHSNFPQRQEVLVSHPEAHVYRPDGILEVNLNGSHPILELIEKSQEEWDAKLRRASKTLDEAVDEYYRRYKRLPPTNFDKW